MGGDKTGDGRFYETMVPLTEKIWEQYLAEQAAGEHDDWKGPEGPREEDGLEGAQVEGHQERAHVARADREQRQADRHGGA